MNSNDDENKKGDGVLTGIEKTSILINIVIGILFFIVLFTNIKPGNQTTEEINISNLAVEAAESSKLLGETSQPINLSHTNNKSISFCERDISGFINDSKTSTISSLNIDNFETTQSEFEISIMGFYDLYSQVNSLTIILNDFSNYLIDFCEENDVISNEVKIDTRSLNELIFHTDNFIKDYDCVSGSCDLLSDIYSAKIKDLYTKILEFCISIVSTDKEYLLNKKNLITYWKEKVVDCKNSTK